MLSVAQHPHTSSTSTQRVGTAHPSAQRMTDVIKPLALQSHRLHKAQGFPILRINIMLCINPEEAAHKALPHPANFHAEVNSQEENLRRVKAHEPHSAADFLLAHSHLPVYRTSCFSGQTNICCDFYHG